MSDNLDFIFYPKTIAVVGASHVEQKIGYVIFKNLLDNYKNGKVYPVNPNRKEILGQKCYPSVKDIPENSIDLVVVTIPAKEVPKIISECAASNVKSVLIISAGFKETGSEGAKLEKEVIELARKANIRVIGPNCLGIINTSNKLNASFAPEMPLYGRVSFLSQSGALGDAIIDWSIEANFGIGKFVSLGNKADLKATDFLEYFGKDSETDIILGYIEDIRDGKRFIEVASNVAKKKPVIILKGGITEAGAKAAASHTGALTSSEIAFNTAFKKAGIIKAEGIRELFEVAEIFKVKNFPKGKNLLIITNAGGAGILAADAADKLGIKLANMSEESINKIKDKLPPSASLHNPLDIIGDATSQRYEVAIQQAIEDNIVEGICVLLTPQAVTDVENVARVIIKKSKIANKPIFACFIGGEKVKGGIKLLKEADVPCYIDPSVAMYSYKKFLEFVENKNKKETKLEIAISEENKKKVKNILDNAKEENISVLKPEDVIEILMTYGFNFPKKDTATTPQQAVEIANKIGYPIVMKINSPDVIHKSDIGGVKLNLKDDKEVLNAFDEILSNVKKHMPGANIKGIDIYEMVTDRKEIILGISYDPSFGHMLMFGLGGIYVEVLKDVSFGIVPIKSKEEAYEMIYETKGAKILDGIRGEKPYDKEDVVDKILKLSKLVEDFPEIKEIDINPYAVKHKGGVILDARIIIS
jgi:acetyltransferase